MCGYVLSNLLNELGKRDKLRGFNCTKARILDSIYLTLKSYNFVIMYATLLWTS